VGREVPGTTGTQRESTDIVTKALDFSCTALWQKSFKLLIHHAAMPHYSPWTDCHLPLGQRCFLSARSLTKTMTRAAISQDLVCIRTTVDTLLVMFVLHPTNPPNSRLDDLLDDFQVFLIPGGIYQDS
jgi:hypothetical protein